jgi:hypothetical protein
MPNDTTRPRFDTLFIDPHHYRADLRLVRSAIRKRWVRPEDRAALVQRVEDAMDERAASPDPVHANSVRRTLGEAWTLLAMESDNIRMEQRDRTGGKLGRPRRRWWVSDFPAGGVLDAGAIRRDMLASGTDISGGLVLAAVVKGPGGELAASVTAAAIQRPPFGLYFVLICPRCGRRRMRLYGTRRGLVCSGCGRLRHRHY